mgnify:FL=1
MFKTLDLRTIIVSYALSNLICAIVLFSLWKQTHGRYKGLDYIMASFINTFLGIGLLALRGVVPDFISLVVGNVILVCGILFLYIGLAKFLNRNLNQTHNYVFLGIYVVFQTWFVYGQANLQARIILFSVLLTIYCIQITWMLLSLKNVKMRSLITGMAVVSILYWVVGIVRIGYELVIPARNDIFSATLFETSIYMVFEGIYIVLTFYLFLMVNRRLVQDLEEDFDEKEIIEEELRFSQDKFSKAFQYSPNAMLISRVEDGKILEANEAFIELYGFEREEVLSSTTITLGVWNTIEDRKEVIRQIEENGFVKRYDFIGRTKSRDLVNLVYSGVGIIVNDEKCLISTLVDTTEEKISQRIIKLRLDLWEYASDHSIIELMTKALDEIEDMTHSKIGFFHLVDHDKKSLLLQAWSTKTKKEFCKAEGENLHYPISRAGVWADCLREKKPLVHNDYPSLTNKRGMPEGHASVQRELVVPVIYKNRAEAVLGVGNKSSDYDKRDVDLVEIIANVTWGIIRQKQDDEQIRLLNDQLNQLAMTDELTKILNRRAFFIKGNEEILRARRYRQPLTAIMLDIDKFKSVNDTLGHETGDLVLQCVAETIRDHIREVDIVGRLGGEEFGVILPNTKAEDAAVLAERLRNAIESGNCITEKIAVSITASLGVAEFVSEMNSLDDLLRDADSAMYEAKNSGRNKVIIFSV